MNLKQVMEEELERLAYVSKHVDQDYYQEIIAEETSKSMIRVVEAALGEVEKDILKKENIMMLDVSFKIQSILNSIKE